MKEELIAVENVKFVQKFYPRTQVNWLTVLKYTDVLKVGGEFPPIEVARQSKGSKTVWLIDGAHRLQAYQKLEEKFIPAIIHERLKEKDIFRLAVERNNLHGLTLSPYEKTKAIIELEKYGFQHEEISKIVAVPIEKINSFKIKKIARDNLGTDHVLKSAIKHFAGMEVGEDVEDVQKSLNMRTQISLIGNLVKIIRRGYIDTTSLIVREALEDLRIALEQIPPLEKTKE